MKRAIEEYFPIIDINRLAVPERNAFKPIYQMHKWFARRSSSVFRAILLGALKPAGTDIMEEFYKDHTNDPDTKGKVILDPFMGGGTTVVEALRLGCKVIGVDLNPVAWFIVKTEVEPVDIDELKEAFERLANRTVEWSGKPLKETLLSLYKTECPACGNKEADIIYTFWVKLAPCTDVTCKAHTPLFADYIISQKSPSIRYIPDYKCPHCDEKFDWEREPVAMVGEERLMVSSGNFSAGIGRTNARWAYSNRQTIKCPWCNETITARFKKPKLKRKKTLLSILYCPHCEEVWQFRGELPIEVRCPTCNHNYNPNEGNYDSEDKRFTCRGVCGGNSDAIIASIRTLPSGTLLPTKAYGIEGYCGRCAPGDKSVKNPNRELFAESNTGDTLLVDNLDDGNNSEVSSSIIWKNKGKFYKRMTAIDSHSFGKASEIWKREKDSLPYPQSEIPDGDKTRSGLLAHHYRYWNQMFNDRQLLALSTLLHAISTEGNKSLLNCLLTAFFNTLNNTSDFTSYRTSVGAARQVFARHDFQPKGTPCEINVWGGTLGMGSFTSMTDAVLAGKEFNLRPYDRRVVQNDNEETLVNINSEEIIDGNDNTVRLSSKSSTDLEIPDKVDLVITDPPYVGNVNYSELSDYFYVWLRLVLKENHPEFTPDITPKRDECIKNRTRNKSEQDFSDCLELIFRECNKVLKNDGILVFTFHHAETSAWVSLLEAICDSGFYVETIYPIHGESEASLHLQDNEAISYDLIHVCKKLIMDDKVIKRPWASIRNEIRKQARLEANEIRAGRYGRQPLSYADTNILLVGKCLELYSKHYGSIVDHDDKPVPINRALEEIKMLVDQITTKEDPLPNELADIDIPSYIYFTTLYRLKEVNSDDVSKSTRGIIETGELRVRGLIIKGREKRGRTFEVKQPLERLEELKRKFQLEWPTEQLTLFDNEGQPILPKDFLFVDCVHLLLGLAETGENLLPWLERFRGLRPQIRAALEYLAQRNPSFRTPAKIVLGLMDERALFTMQTKT